MDFSYSDDQQAVIDLASQIFDEHATHERQREVEAQEGPRFDTELWKLLAEAGLVGAAIPEESGGAGLGFLEVAGILEQAGRHTAPIPLLETMVLAGLPIAAHGSAAQQEAWLPKFAAGEAIGTAALIEAQADPREPGTTATPEGSGFRLRGRKICVPSAELAAVVLVPVRTPDGVGLFLVDPKAEGVVLTALDTTSGRPESALALDVVVGADAVLADASAGEAALDALLERANAAQAAFGTRKQFDQPIATFQAVGHRAADAYIDVEAIRLTTLQAAWRLAEGLPAAAHVALAKYWVAEAGQRVVAAAQHLHGGVGVDREYPLHRCYLLAKEIELALGGTTPQLLRIGRILADQPAA
jgi:alkylation response protein AidB-like acyl-CoA dehydrogenase